ncbi:unnamed protein product [Calypogeia fissa]
MNHQFLLAITIFLLAPGAALDHTQALTLKSAELVDNGNIQMYDTLTGRPDPEDLFHFNNWPSQYAVAVDYFEEAVIVEEAVHYAADHGTFDCDGATERCQWRPDVYSVPVRRRRQFTGKDVLLLSFFNIKKLIRLFRSAMNTTSRDKVTIGPS